MRPRPGPAHGSRSGAADLTAYPEIGSVALSADGALVAAVVTTPDVTANRYRRVVVTGPADGSAELRPLAGGTEADSLPAWAPAGTVLATVRRDDAGWGIWLSRHGRQETRSPSSPAGRTRSRS